MDSIANMIQFKQQKETKTLPWQELALDIIKELRVPVYQKGSVFKCCKTDERRARFALTDCQELGKRHLKYFFKVYSELNKNI